MLFDAERSQVGLFRCTTPPRDLRKSATTQLMDSLASLRILITRLQARIEAIRTQRQEDRTQRQADRTQRQTFIIQKKLFLGGILVPLAALVGVVAIKVLILRKTNQLKIH